MVSIRMGLPPGQRAAAARLYWEAFGGKLTTVLGPEDRALVYLDLVIRADHCFVAQDDGGTLLGIAGFKSPFGSFAGGSMADLRAAYGRLGALWRGLALRALGNEVDNQRFLVDGVAVTRAARGQGIGSALVAALCEEARLRGYGAVRLEVVDSNLRARALYERLGFVATDRVQLGVLQPIFGFAAAITMVRALDSRP